MNKKLLTLAVAAAMAAPTASYAVKYKLSGQINRAMVAADDGTNSDIQFVDNTSSGTRWRMKGSEDIGNGMKVGFNWEWQIQSNPSGTTINGNGNFGASPGFDGKQSWRKAEVWFSGGWGKLSFGQGDGAGNGATEVDLSDTWNVNYSGRTSFAGNVQWRTGSGGYITSSGTTTDPDKGLTHGDTFSAWDAFSRYDRIRYDSPSLGPVVLSVSAGAVDRYEGAARWSQGLGGGQISAAAFYGQEAGSVDSRYGGSIGYLFSFGTNIGANFGSSQKPGAGEVRSDTWYFKVGHKWGNNAASFGYGESQDKAKGFKNKGFNIGYNYNIPKAKVDLYAGYHFNQLDTPSNVPGVDDIQAFVIGTKLKFD